MDKRLKTDGHEREVNVGNIKWANKRKDNKENMESLFGGRTLLVVISQPLGGWIEMLLVFFCIIFRHLMNCCIKKEWSKSGADCHCWVLIQQKHDGFLLFTSSFIKVAPVRHSKTLDTVERKKKKKRSAVRILVTHNNAHEGFLFSWIMLGLWFLMWDSEDGCCCRFSLSSYIF